MLEVGPGTGNMTVKLLEECKKVSVLLSSSLSFVNILLQSCVCVWGGGVGVWVCGVRACMRVVTCHVG